MPYQPQVYKGMQQDPTYQSFQQMSQGIVGALSNAYQMKQRQEEIARHQAQQAFLNQMMQQKQWFTEMDAGRKFHEDVRQFDDEFQQSKTEFEAGPDQRMWGAIASGEKTLEEVKNSPDPTERAWYMKNIFVPEQRGIGYGSGSTTKYDLIAQLANLLPHYKDMNDKEQAHVEGLMSLVASGITPAMLGAIAGGEGGGLNAAGFGDIADRAGSYKRQYDEQAKELADDIYERKNSALEKMARGGTEFPWEQAWMEAQERLKIMSPITKQEAASDLLFNQGDYVPTSPRDATIHDKGAEALIKIIQEGQSLRPGGFTPVSEVESETESMKAYLRSRNME